jgi:hypothetical protein
MKIILSTITFSILSLQAFAGTSIYKGSVLLNGENTAVSLRLTFPSYSSKDHLKLGKDVLRVISTSGQIEVMAESENQDKTIMVYLKDNFKALHSQLKEQLEFINPSNLDEIQCDPNSEVNAFLVVYENFEPYNAYANCLVVSQN